MTAKNIVFDDSRVTGYRAFFADLGVDTEWYVLDATQDGVERMRRVLGDRNAIHDYGLLRAWCPRLGQNADHIEFLNGA
jgi:hypothetical protein